MIRFIYTGEQNVPGEFKTSTLSRYRVLDDRQLREVWIERDSLQQGLPLDWGEFTVWSGRRVFILGDTTQTPYLFVVEFPVPESFYAEFVAWYKEEHVPMLLENPDWSGTELFQADSECETEYSFTSLHYLTHAKALESPERQASRATPWFKRLQGNSWFDRAFNRWLLAQSETVSTS